MYVLVWQTPEPDILANLMQIAAVSPPDAVASADVSNVWLIRKNKTRTNISNMFHSNNLIHAEFN